MRCHLLFVPVLLPSVSSAPPADSASDSLAQLCRSLTSDRKALDNLRWLHHLPTPAAVCRRGSRWSGRCLHLPPPLLPLTMMMTMMMMMTMPFFQQSDKSLSVSVLGSHSFNISARAAGATVFLKGEIPRPPLFLRVAGATVFLKGGICRGPERTPAI